MIRNSILQCVDAVSLAWIRRKLKKYDVIFFDVFDTLLKRDVTEPKQVFFLLETQNRIPGFAESRIHAEINSRSRKSEVTLDDIYSDNLLKEYQWVKPLEIELEQKLSCCNAPIKAVYDYCVREKKRIFIITDMYLPEAVIAFMLKKNGYGQYEKLYVSGFEQASKITGDLFRRVLQDNQLRASSVMHIGDNVHKDGFGAMKAGIFPCLIRTKTNRLAYGKNQTDLTAFCSNRIDELPERGEKLGFEVFGPLLVAFTQWVHRQVPKGEDVFFLARDMDLVYRIYTDFYGSTSRARYLEVSRTSIARSEARFDSHWLAYAWEALPKQLLTKRDLREELGLETDTDEDEACVFDLRTDSAEGNVMNYLEQVQNMLKQSAGMDNDTLSEYLAQEGVTDRSILVDIGYGGTIQKMLNRKLNIHTSGLYLASNQNLARNIPSGDFSVFSFWGEPAPLRFSMGQPLLEHLISEPVGKTVDYQLTGGVIQPVHKEGSGEEPIKRAIRRGVMEFARAYRESPYFSANIDPEEAMEIYLRFLSQPTLKDVALLNACLFEDGGQYNIIHFGSHGQYFRHPGLLLRDFRESHWKAAFLKLLFRLPLPYGSMYIKLKTFMQKKQTGE